MAFSMTGPEKGGLLKQVTSWAGLTLNYCIEVQSSLFPIKGPEGHTDNTATYTFIIKTHILEQFNQNEITLQDCGIINIIIYRSNFVFIN